MRFYNLFKHLLLKYKYAAGKLGRVLALTAVTSLVCAAITSAAGSTQLVSVNRYGTNSGNLDSYNPVISADGRFVAFESRATDLVDNDTNNEYDIFVRDLQNGTTTLASANRDGTNSGNYRSLKAVLSADGRFVAFESGASDLVDNDTNNRIDIFVRDLQNGVTILASINRFGTNSGNQDSVSPALSADGRFVAFESGASDLVDNDANYRKDVFVRDLQNGTTILVSANHNGTNSGSDRSYGPVINANGRFVAFESTATDLVDNDMNSRIDIYVRDLQNGTTTLASVNRDGTDSGNQGSYYPTLSADGRFVAFNSGASDLVDNDTNNTYDAFVRDLQNGTTILASVNRDGTHSGNGDSYTPVLSADGRFVAFVSRASDLAGNDTNNDLDIYVRDLQNGTTTLASINRDGTNAGNYGAYRGVISADGRFVAFDSGASDLVDNDTNNTADVFVRDLQNGTTTVASVNRDGTNGGNSYSYGQVFSANVRFVAFVSMASDLVSDDTNNTFDIFVHDLIPDLPPTPRQGIEGLIDRVDELVAGDVLNQGQGNALIVKLEAAIMQLDRGNYHVAINQLQAFINQVETMIRSGVLSPEAGHPLIDLANEIIAILSPP